MGGSGFSRGYALFQRHLEDQERPGEFELLGRSWELMDGVFSPAYTPVTRLFSGWLPYPPDGSFLEVGSGAGVTAVHAALSGCGHVTALDISEAAVENTRRNIHRHGVQDRTRVMRSDLFDALPAADRFDLIFWNSSFAEPPEEFVNQTDLHHAFFDPGYAAHRRYLSEAPKHLTPDGRLMLGFSSIGNWPLLREICKRTGLDIEVIHSETRELEVTIRFELAELTPATGLTWADLALRDPLRDAG